MEDRQFYIEALIENVQLLSEEVTEYKRQKRELLDVLEIISRWDDLVTMRQFVNEVIKDFEE